MGPTLPGDIVQCPADYRRLQLTGTLAGKERRQHARWLPPACADMKIVVFGLTISSSWGNGHATLWRALCRALARRGHTVVFIERDVPYYAAHRDLAPGDWWEGELVLFADWRDVREKARRHLSEADVGIITSYCPDGIAATSLLLESPARLRVFYDLDTPVTLDTLQSGQAVSYISARGLVDFDLVLSYTGGRALTELRSRLGARRVATLYGSVDPEAHRAAPPEERFRADLSYLGTYARDRQAALAALLIEPARRLPGRRFLIAGAQYPESFPWGENIYFVRHLEPAQHSAFFSSCRLTLNVTRRPMKEMGYCPSGRLFEAAACGAPLLSDYWEGLELFFKPGVEIIVARDSDEATAAVELSDAELSRIGQQARERMLHQHTAAQRALEFEAAIAAAQAGGWSALRPELAPAGADSSVSTEMAPRSGPPLVAEA
jgi:spore maturation protein CgeB